MTTTMGFATAPRYETAQEQLPAEVWTLLSDLRAKERTGEVPSALTNAYLLALKNAGWTLRVLANAFDNVTIEAVRERVIRAQQLLTGPTQSDTPAVTLKDTQLDRDAAAAWDTWASATSRPEGRTQMEPEFYRAYTEMRGLNYPHDQLVRNISGAALLPPRPRDPRDVRRVVGAMTRTDVELAAEAALKAGDPAQPFPAHEGSPVDAERLAEQLAALPVPVPAKKETVKAEPEREPKYRIPEDIAATIVELQARAKKVKGTTSAESEDRGASEELAKLVYSELSKGATYYQLSQVAGVSWNAIKFRLGRYGFVPLPPSMVHTFVKDIAGLGFAPTAEELRAARGEEPVPADA